MQHRTVVALLAALLAAVLGFAAGFGSASVLGIFGTMNAECDGVCFDRLDEVFWVAIGVGSTSAIGFGLAGRSIARRAVAERDRRRTITRVAAETRRLQDSPDG